MPELDKIGHMVRVTLFKALCVVQLNLGSYVLFHLRNFFIQRVGFLNLKQNVV